MTHSATAAASTAFTASTVSSAATGHVSRTALQRIPALLLCALALGACAQTPPAAPPSALPPASGGLNAGLSLTEQASASDLGLPIYPGAQLRRDGPDDKAAFNLGLWGGTLGLKLVVAKYQTGDEAERVARFYRQAMARYGTLLDCGDPKAPRAKNSPTLSCENDKPDAGGYLYKAGVPKNYRLVSVSPLRDGQTELNLVRVETR